MTFVPGNCKLLEIQILYYLTFQSSYCGYFPDKKEKEETGNA